MASNRWYHRLSKLSLPPLPVIARRPGCTPADLPAVRQMVDVHQAPVRCKRRCWSIRDCGQPLGEISQAGMNAYVSKPIQPEEVFEAIEDAVLVGLAS
jgi:CheY-like chemotaxis protein